LIPTRVILGALVTWSACLVVAATISPATIRLSEGRDLWAHAVGYGLHGALTLAAIRRTGLTLPMSAGLAVMLSSLFGLATEGLQLMVPGRDPSVADLIADAIGASFGTAASVGWVRIRARGETEPP
jgi:VanZ family protein